MVVACIIMVIPVYILPKESLLNYKRKNDKLDSVGLKTFYP